MLIIEANNQKPRLDTVSERCEALMAFCGHCPVRDKTVKLQVQFSSVVASIQVSSVLI